MLTSMRNHITSVSPSISPQLWFVTATGLVFLVLFLAFAPYRDEVAGRIAHCAGCTIGVHCVRCTVRGALCGVHCAVLCVGCFAT